MEDALLWTESLEDMFQETCFYIYLCSEAGITFNHKFVFGQKKVEFLGFHLSEEGVPALDKFLQAGMDLPNADPRDITGARSWFGLIQQVNYAYSEFSPMAPLRQLLKPSSRYKWTPFFHILAN